MKFSYLACRETYAVVPVLVMVILLASGCASAGDSPTNTARSTYNSTGKTAADKIGEMRAKRRPIDRGAPATATPGP
jgi:hypothetical protein